MQESNLWYLQNIDITGLFCPGKMESNPDKHGEHLFKKGEYIYLPEDESDRIYFIVDGRIKIGTMQGDREIIKAILGKGEVFGELAMMMNRRKDFAFAMEDTEVCTVHKDAIQELLRDRGPLQQFFLSLFGKRLLETESRLHSLVFKDARSRIIEFLIELAKVRGERVGYETVVRKFLTHQEIANITATSRQTVTTVLNDLRNQEIIKFDRRRLLIRDQDRLADALLTADS